MSNIFQSLLPLDCNLSLTMYIGIGSVIFWSLKGRQELGAYALSELLDLTSLSGFKRAFIELFIFVIFGCIVAAAFVQPATPAQALAAGFGWTGLLSHRRDKNRTAGN